MNKVVGNVARRGTPKRSSTPNLIPVRSRCGPGSTTRASRSSSVRRSCSCRHSIGEFAEVVDATRSRSVVLPPAAMVMLADDEQVTSLDRCNGCVDHCAAVTVPGSPFPRPLRRRHPQLLRPDRSSVARSSAGARPTGVVRRDQAAARSAGRTKGSRFALVGEELGSVRPCRWPDTPTCGHVGDRLNERRLVPDWRHRLRRRGRLRVGRRSHLRPDQPRRHEGHRAKSRRCSPPPPACRSRGDRRPRRPTGRSADRVRGADDPERAAEPWRAPGLTAPAHPAAWKVPVRSYMVATLPRNEVGKSPQARAYLIARTLEQNTCVTDRTSCSSSPTRSGARWIPARALGPAAEPQPAPARGHGAAQHYTHSSPCSPSRATLLTGQYVPEHGVTDNVFVDPAQPDLHTATPTHRAPAAAAGYRTRVRRASGTCRMATPTWSGTASPTGRARTGPGPAWRAPARTSTRSSPRKRPMARRPHGDERRAVVPRRRAREPARHHWYPGRPTLVPGRPPRGTGSSTRSLAAPIPGQPAIADVRRRVRRAVRPARQLRRLPRRQAGGAQAWRWEEHH